jgi:hypothetical protein
MREDPTLIVFFSERTLHILAENSKNMKLSRQQQELEVGRWWLEYWLV